MKFNLKQFDPDKIDAPGRDSTKLAIWMLKKNRNVTFDEVRAAAKKLRLPISGRAWGAARDHVGIKRPKSRSAARRARRTRATNQTKEAPGGLPLDQAINRIESLESELQAVKSTLENIRSALYGQ
ncbi:MAG: hypothetical protein ACE5F1_06045 [Planctomycetota bacterium]